MSEAYVADLCNQLEELGSLAGKSGCVRTRSGKVQVDHSLTGLMWRKLINSEDESRASTVSGMEALLSTVNDYVASTLKLAPILRNVFVAPKTSGKIVENVSKSPQKAMSSSVSNEITTTTTVNTANAVEIAQKQFFAECNVQIIAGLKNLAVSTRNACKGIADLLSRRYNHDFEIVPLLIDQINFATLIVIRIEEATASK